MSTFNKIGFGGGCHWCTEAIFQSLRGVNKVEQGWVSSDVPNESPSEAVIVHFNTDIISQSILLSIHLNTHSCTTNHSMRSKYRSAVYTFSEEQQQQVKVELAELQQYFNKKIITQILPLRIFKLNQESFLNYYYSNPEKPFCQSYISPKLKILIEKFADHLNAEYKYSPQQDNR